jgi:hypothetical protein
MITFIDSATATNIKTKNRPKIPPINVANAGIIEILEIYEYESLSKEYNKITIAIIIARPEMMPIIHAKA